MVDVLEGKLNLAKSLGADVVINSKEEDPVAKVKALTGGKGADFFFFAILNLHYKKG